MKEKLQRLYSDIGLFSRGVWPDYRLRPYQLEPARALVRAVLRPRTGGPDSFAVVFSRQSGKDEMLAQLLAYLLHCCRARGGSVVLAAPTARQAAISQDRLRQRLDHPLSGREVRRRGYITGLGRASARFLTAAPGANVRGETASLLLVANEAQDIDPAHWDAVFDPMAAAANAPTLFMGTVWTGQTLLARQMRHLRRLEAADGRQRVFEVDWRRVSEHLPAYGERVRQRIHQFGERHPFIQTEYFLRELDGSGGLFGPERQGLMRGSHPRQSQAAPGRTYCLLVDVGGGAISSDPDGGQAEPSPARDSTAVTVVEVERPADDLNIGPALGLPSYRVVDRQVWTGTPHPELYGRLVGLARDTWRARYVVVDATGLGASLAAFLDRALPRRVVPFVFSQASKSELGWQFCGLVDSGRFKDYADDGAADTGWWWRQVAAVEYEVRPGPGQVMRWSVPDPRLHDDLVVSAALCAVLDRQDWRPRHAAGVTG